MIRKGVGFVISFVWKQQRLRRRQEEEEEEETPDQFRSAGLWCVFASHQPVFFTCPTSNKAQLFVI